MITFGDISLTGYYLALRVGFAFPSEEENRLPSDWVEHYTKERYMLEDPVIRWIYANTGAVRWDEIDISDPSKVLEDAQAYGLKYGAAVSCMDASADGRRSFGTFVRGTAPFSDVELRQLEGLVQERHYGNQPPSNLTDAELEALRMVKSGLRLKEIAYDLGVSEGAIKQRLKGAKDKLGARNSTHAATLASDHGLI